LFELTFLFAVAVWVVAPEEQASLIGVDDFVEPTDGLSGASLAEILLVDL
jgi:hypothetical protein